MQTKRIFKFLQLLLLDVWVAQTLPYPWVLAQRGLHCVKCRWIGLGEREEEREGEAEGCVDDPAKRIQVQVASGLQELLHKAPLSSFHSAFLIMNFLHVLNEADWPVPFQKPVASPKQGPSIQRSMLVLGVESVAQLGHPGPPAFWTQSRPCNSFLAHRCLFIAALQYLQTLIHLQGCSADSRRGHGRLLLTKCPQP